MDILDIDEALKDDSFIFLEEKTHDDVSNILQQWKINNCLQQQSEHPQEQVYKLNSRTFTRPKRKTAQNLESQFSNMQPYTSNSAQNGGYQQTQPSAKMAPMLNLEIGGLVTTMHKSFLQDTSPPSSICSSMDVSFERMNNSLITSADFANVNFLQSTQSLDFHDKDSSKAFNLTNKSTIDGYTLCDVIRDRKALESLTISGDGTLIKDSNIAQIDDISLALSKTASGCSTMDNSTESMECNNQTVELLNKNATYHNIGNIGNVGNRVANDDDLISDTTFNLVENSMCALRAHNPNDDKDKDRDNDNDKDSSNNVAKGLNVTHNVCDNMPSNETFRKPTLLDETVCVVGSGSNLTFDCQQPLTPDTRCETPEGNNKPLSAMKIYESTPHTSNVRYNKQQFTPSIKMAEDVNISPIVAPKSDQFNSTQTLDGTFEQPQQKHPLPEEARQSASHNSNTFSGVLPGGDCNNRTAENHANSNETYNKNIKKIGRAAADIFEMQNVIDLAQAEADLLVGYDEVQFEKMLNKFGHVELNDEQLKMKKSLETIKKRFNYGGFLRDDKNSGKIAEIKDNEPAGNESNDEHNSNNAEEHMTMRDITLDGIRKDSKSSDLCESDTSVLSTREVNDSTAIASASTSPAALSTAASTSASGERLLNRRSRLYDDFVLSSVNTPTKTTTTDTASTSFTVHRNEVHAEDGSAGIGYANETDYVEMKGNSKTENARTKNPANENCAQEEPMQANAKPQSSMYKLAEKRERDRDRFKTIQISRAHPHYEGDCKAGIELALPCIDNDTDYVQDAENVCAALPSMMPQRHSRRDDTQVEEAAPLSSKILTTNTKINTNYLTYKKPKEKPTKQPRNLPEVAYLDDRATSGSSETAADTATAATTKVAAKPRLQPRSLSRPRYIGGLQKFNVVSKATSAGDLDNTTIIGNTSLPKHQLNLNVDSTALSDPKLYDANAKFNQTQPQINPEKSVSELKSPMGVKSNSFHNLTNHFGYQNASVGMSIPKLTNAIGQQRGSSAAAAGNCEYAGMPGKKQKHDDAVFKVPKLVSGIRAPSTSIGGGSGGGGGGGIGGATNKRLARPSSGYYSLNVTTKVVTQQANNVDQDMGIPTEAVHTNPSRNFGPNSNNNQHFKQSSASSAAAVGHTPAAATAALTKISVGSTGIPKPTGLRPPCNLKRSGLPKPANLAKR